MRGRIPAAIARSFWLISPCAQSSLTCRRTHWSICSLPERACGCGPAPTTCPTTSPVPTRADAASTETTTASSTAGCRSRATEAGRACCGRWCTMLASTSMPPAALSSVASTMMPCAMWPDERCCSFSCACTHACRWRFSPRSLEKRREQRSHCTCAAASAASSSGTPITGAKAEPGAGGAPVAPPAPAPEAAPTPDTAPVTKAGPAAGPVRFAMHTVRWR